MGFRTVKSPMPKLALSAPPRVALLATACALAAPGFAAEISWQSPASVTSDGALSQNGFLVHAGNFRSSGDLFVTVGSGEIHFQNRPAQNEPGELQEGEEARVIQGAGGKQTNANLFDAAGTTVSANFHAILDGSAWENADAGPAPGLTDMVLRVTGAAGEPLVEGASYEIQVFYSDDRAGSSTRGQTYHDGLGNFSEPVIAGDSTGVIGTFTADATGYQDIHIQNTTGGTNFPVALNAYVLRAISSDDLDGDDLPDLWEIANGLDPEDATGDNGKAGDPDGDDFSNHQEYLAGSDPQWARSVPGDIDGDGLPDEWEMTHFGGLGYSDFDDPDGDFAFNDEEYAAGTDPNDRLDAPDEDGPDGEGDGMGDAWELYYFFDTSREPEGDEDGDGVSNLQEWLDGTDPTDPLDPFAGVTEIVWGAPLEITDDSVLTGGGVIVHAGNFRSDNQEVTVTAGAGTITFKNRQNTGGALLEGEEARVISGSGGRQVNAGLFDPTETTVSPEFEAVLDGSAWEDADPGPAPGATDLVLRLAGAGGAPLVEGQQYRIQLFYSDDRPGSVTRAQLYHDGLGNESEAVLAPSSTSVTGTFTATEAGYMDVFVRNTSGGANFPVGLNGYVLRAVVEGDADSDGDGMPDAWEIANGLDPNSDDADGDADGDGISNLAEFAFNGDPRDPSDRGVNQLALQDTDSSGHDELTLTIAVRAGATFAAGTGGNQTATIDGITYTVRGTLDLEDFSSPVVHVASAASDDPDYELHTFRLTASEGLADKGFLQAVVSAP